MLSSFVSKTCSTLLFKIATIKLQKGSSKKYNRDKRSFLQWSLLIKTLSHELPLFSYNSEYFTGALEHLSKGPFVTISESFLTQCNSYYNTYILYVMYLSEHKGLWDVLICCPTFASGLLKLIAILIVCTQGWKYMYVRNTNAA